MFSLPLHERLLVAAILLAVVLGVSVKHWRDARREALGRVPIRGSATSTAAYSPPAAPASDRRHP